MSPAPPPDPPLPDFVIVDPDDSFELHAGPFYWNGRDRFAFRAEPRHCNSHGTLHGGLLMTFIDLVLGTVAKENPAEESAVTVSMNSNFVAPGREGDLVEARAEAVRRTKSLSFVRGEVFVEDRVLLTATSVVKRIRRER
jgi:uncharacterized protein (TIGR00369 family)